MQNVASDEDPDSVITPQTSFVALILGFLGVIQATTMAISGPFEAKCQVLYGGLGRPT